MTLTSGISLVKLLIDNKNMSDTWKKYEVNSVEERIK